MSKSYIFRLRISTPHDQILNIDKKSYKINLSHSGEFIIRPKRAKKLNEARTFEITSSPFTTKEEAEEIAKQLQLAFLITGVRLFEGYNTGEDTYYLNDGYYKSEFQDGAYHFNTPEIVEPCIEIHENQIQNKGGIVDFHLIDLGNYRRLFEVLQRAFVENKKVSDKQRLALLICNFTKFQKSEEAIFVSLVTAIEVLSKRKDRDCAERKIIEQLISYVKNSKLPHDSISSIVGSLKDLRQISIGNSCREFICGHLGRDRAKEFKRLYNVRSQLVHTGKTKNNVGLSKELYVLEGIVRSALIIDIYGKDIFHDVI